MVRHKFIAGRFDGGKSPLGGDVDIGDFPIEQLLPEDDIVVDSVREPNTSGTGSVIQPNTDTPLQFATPGRWPRAMQNDYDAIMAGKPPAVGSWMDKQLRSWGIDPKKLDRMSHGKRRRMIDKLGKLIRRMEREMYDSVEAGIRLGRGEYAYGNVPGDTSKHAYSVERSNEYRRARQRVFDHLEGTWSRGPLVLERPQGSSLHHMMDYDSHAYDSTSDVDAAKHAYWKKTIMDAQVVLVENDWGAAVPPVEGEWRVPFAFMCWEFRISGVRVIAFTEADNEPPIMWMVYGAADHWVADDFRYELGCPQLPRGIPWPGNSNMREMRRVAKMCYDTIRAACIMLDARVAHNDRVAASSKLSERRVREGKVPLRDHYVVRLIDAHGRQRAHRERTGALQGIARAPQRGHWRAGTWVHFDDQDSGQVQYPNDGGFLVSKTWRRWHFAGDPKNIIHKEYKL